MLSSNVLLTLTSIRPEPVTLKVADSAQQAERSISPLPVTSSRSAFADPRISTKLLPVISSSTIAILSKFYTIINFPGA